MEERSQEKQEHLMIDIETTGIRPGCGIWNIGAKFKQSGDTFSMSINPAVLLMDNSLEHDPNTIRWQFEKNFSNWGDALSKPPMNSMLDLLWSFHDWLMAGLGDNTEVWSRGNFDFPILEHAFKQVGKSVPWKYYQLNDLRTLTKFYGIQRREASHDAFDDVLRQLEDLKYCLKRRDM